MGKWIHRFSSYDEFYEAYNNSANDVISFETADGAYKFVAYDDEFDDSGWYNSENGKTLTVQSKIPKVGIWNYAASGTPFDENGRLLDSFVGAINFYVEWDGQGDPPEEALVEITSVKTGMYRKPWLSAVDGGVPSLKITADGEEGEFEYIGKKIIREDLVN